MPRLFRIVILAIFIFAAGAAGQFGVAPQPAVLAAPALQTGDPVIGAAGDIANCSNQEDYYTGYLLEGIDGPVLALGDTAYESGSTAEFRDCYDPSWGRLKGRTYPAIGNHEYLTGGAAGYFTYFGDAASPLEPGCKRDCKGYYSFNVGTWHLIALNSEISMDPGSPQEQWLRSDLAANPAVCTLAYWHKPRYSSGYHGSTTGIGAWQALYDYGADVVLVGHDHDYERFAPQDNRGQIDTERGIREFVVGTGGATLRDFKFIQPNSEVHNSETWGVLKMTLRPTSYDWEFIPIPGQTFTDSGSSPCVTAPNLPPPPAAPALTTGPTLVSTVAPDSVAAPVPVAGTDYVVQAGDTLGIIAERYGLDWETIAAANGLGAYSIIEIGQVIRLPGAQSAPAAASPVAASPALVAGPVAAPVTTAPVTTAPVAAAPSSVTATGAPYIVKAGDTLFSIALSNNLTWQALAAANKLTENDFLQIGQTLIIPGKSTTPAASAAPVAAAPAAAPVTTVAPAPTAGVHIVVSGDTIFGIAIKNGVDWQELMRLNGLTESSVLQIGQQIRLK